MKKIVLIALIAAAILLPTIAVLHADMTGSSATHAGDDNDQGQNHNAQDHDDNETSDDGMGHIEDTNENETD